MLNRLTQGLGTRSRGYNVCFEDTFDAIARQINSSARVSCIGSLFCIRRISLYQESTCISQSLWCDLRKLHLAVVFGHRKCALLGIKNKLYAVQKFTFQNASIRQPPRQVLDYALATTGGSLFRANGLDRRDVLGIVVEQFEPVFDRVALREYLVLFELDTYGSLQVLD